MPETSGCGLDSTCQIFKKFFVSVGLHNFIRLPEQAAFERPTKDREETGTNARTFMCSRRRTRVPVKFSGHLAQRYRHRSASIVRTLGVRKSHLLCDSESGVGVERAR